MMDLFLITALATLLCFGGAVVTGMVLSAWLGFYRAASAMAYGVACSLVMGPMVGLWIFLCFYPC